MSLGLPIHELLVRMAIGIPATAAGMLLVVAIAAAIANRRRS